MRYSLDKYTQTLTVGLHFLSLPFLQNLHSFLLVVLSRTTRKPLGVSRLQHHIAINSELHLCPVQDSVSSRDGVEIQVPVKLSDTED